MQQQATLRLIEPSLSAQRTLLTLVSLLSRFLSHSFSLSLSLSLSQVSPNVACVPCDIVINLSRCFVRFSSCLPSHCCLRLRRCRCLSRRRRRRRREEMSQIDLWSLLLLLHPTGNNFIRNAHGSFLIRCAWLIPRNAPLCRVLRVRERERGAAWPLDSVTGAL